MLHFHYYGRFWSHMRNHQLSPTEYGYMFWFGKHTVCAAETCTSVSIRGLRVGLQSKHYSQSFPDNYKHSHTNKTIRERGRRCGTNRMMFGSGKLRRSRLGTWLISYQTQWPSWTALNELSIGEMLMQITWPQLQVVSELIFMFSMHSGKLCLHSTHRKRITWCVVG